MAFIIGGSAADIVTSSEHWPFSRYAMFSDKRTPYVYACYAARGVLPDGSERDVLAAFKPLSARLQYSLKRHAAEGTADRAARELLLWHRRSRPDERLFAIRIYRFDYDLTQVRDGLPVEPVATIIAEATDGPVP
jgi:hypothetical protein